MLYQKSGKEIHDLYINHEISAEEITHYFLRRIKHFDPLITALISLLEERAIQTARSLDQKRKAEKPLGKLAGIPIIIKDNIHIRQEFTTCASQLLKNYRAPFNATVVRLIEKEDGIVIGKSNLDEFSMGSATETSAFHITKNPWDVRYTPGGSCGGSAASVAARLAPMALGVDTGGSIRQPSSFCNLFGLKPTYGRVSRFGVVAFGSSLDQVGPMTRSIQDLALLQEVIGAPCNNDATSIHNPPDSYNLDNYCLQDKVIGVPFSLLTSIHGDVIQTFHKALEIYKELGAKIISIDLPFADYMMSVYCVLSAAEVSANLARFDGVRFGERAKDAKSIEELYERSRSLFGREVKQRILLGTLVLSKEHRHAYYQKAQQIRSLMIKEYNKIFSQCDVIAMPTTPTPAFLSQSIQGSVSMYQQDIFTVSANIVGIPAISHPIGFSSCNLPIGMQIQAPILQEQKILQFASLFAKKECSHQKIPSLFDKEAP